MRFSSTQSSASFSARLFSVLVPCLLPVKPATAVFVIADGVSNFFRLFLALLSSTFSKSALVVDLCFLSRLLLAVHRAACQSLHALFFFETIICKADSNGAVRKCMGSILQIGLDLELPSVLTYPIS